jgi:hypothetical protein
MGFDDAERPAKPLTRKAAATRPTSRAEQEAGRVFHGVRRRLGKLVRVLSS